MVLLRERGLIMAVRIRVSRFRQDCVGLAKGSGSETACISFGLSYFSEIGCFVRSLPAPEGKTRVQDQGSIIVQLLQQ